jgi:hypothetical protein
MIITWLQWKIAMVKHELIKRLQKVRRMYEGGMFIRIAQNTQTKQNKG